MPSWIETKKEIDRRNKDYDSVRRERIRAVEAISSRPLVIYASAFLNEDKAQTAVAGLGIDEYDRLGFDEVTTELAGPNLDVLIHSPGGLPEAAESIVHLLRSRFDHIRFIVPHMAKSAATMICCAGNEILMDERSELGPIDPQLRLTRGKNIITAPAQAIIDQFDKAKEMLAANPGQLPAWLPLLEPLAPALLTQCEAANKLSHSLVENWLVKYMLAGQGNAAALAAEAARYLADSRTHLSHGRRIGLQELQALGLNVVDLRTEPAMRAAVWSLYQAIHWTFEETGAFKIIEHRADRVFIRQIVVQQIQLSPKVGQPSAGPKPGLPLSPMPNLQSPGGKRSKHGRRR